MRIEAVKNNEVGRIDLFLLRTMGEYTTKTYNFLLYFNPGFNPINLKIGTVLKIPSRSEQGKVRLNRYYFDSIHRI